jgi:hypothetical protein
MRESQARFSQARADGQIKCKASAEVLLAVLTTIGGYSRMNDTIGIRQIEKMIGVPKSTIARALDELEAAGCISRVIGDRGYRGLIALPIVEPVEQETDQDADEEQVSHGEPVGVPPIGMGPTEKTASEKKAFVCELEGFSLRARAVGRSGTDHAHDEQDHGKPTHPQTAGTANPAWCDPVKDAERRLIELATPKSSAGPDADRIIEWETTQ